MIERMREAIAVYDITSGELGFDGSGKAKKAAPKKSAKAGAKLLKPGAAYSDGKGNSWGGRGPRPAWLKEALAAGATLEEFATERSKP